MPSVADFLIERLHNSGIQHVFGLPGDYILSFYKKLSDFPKIELINTTDESHAGFAADAYARVKGVGCVCVTYNVGALKLANSIACAYAERSPVVLISGSPGLKERGDGVLLHHMVRSFECQKQIFENITCASTVLDNPSTAGYEIDRVFEALKHHKQPIYIELPRDVAEKPLDYDVYRQGTPRPPVSDPENLNEALEETISWINSAKNPVILAGVQLARYGLGNEVTKFAEKLNIPIATTLLSKSVVDESHPLFLGVYAGKASKQSVREIVESSDCLLMLGVMITDMNFGFMPVKFEKRQTVISTVEELKVKNHAFSNVTFLDFTKSLFKSNFDKKPFAALNKMDVSAFSALAGQKLKVARLFEKINSILDENTAIIADIGDSLFGAIDLVIKRNNGFLSPAFYTSMGFAIPGALGFATAAPNVRPIVLVGDGAFQMSCNELSTIVKRKQNAIVIVLNNHGFTTERFLLDGPFNDVAEWNYEKLVEVVGGKGFKVETEDELESALSYGLVNKGLTLINAILDADDISVGLDRMTKALSKKL